MGVVCDFGLDISTEFGEQSWKQGFPEEKKSVNIGSGLG